MYIMNFFFLYYYDMMIVLNPFIGSSPTKVIWCTNETQRDKTYDYQIYCWSVAAVQ